MSFEEQANLYIDQLIEDGTILDGDLYGVKEQDQTAKGVGNFLENGIVVEKHMFFYMSDNQITWSFYVPA